jgi:hypothetical protein
MGTKSIAAVDRNGRDAGDRRIGGVRVVGTS